MPNNLTSISQNPYCDVASCKQLRAPGSTRCVGHSKKVNPARRYVLIKHQEKLNALMQDDDFKSLKEEIAVLRLMLGEILSKCEGPFDFIVHEPKITKITEAIGRMTVQTHKLENAMGNLLDKSTLMLIADRFIQTVTENVKDEKIIEVIYRDITDAIEQQQELLSDTVSAEAS